MGRIVVGVDGSEGSRRALDWAVREASLRGASLDVIHTYEHNPVWRAYANTEDMSAAAVAQMRKAMEQASAEAARHAQETVDSMVAGLDSAAVQGRAVQSHHPAETLVEESRGADMLVVGSRGRGSFKSLMLGSVSQQCAHHAECPVVIIRAAGDTEH